MPANTTHLCLLQRRGQMLVQDGKLFQPILQLLTAPRTNERRLLGKRSRQLVRPHRMQSSSQAVLHANLESCRISCTPRFRQYRMQTSSQALSHANSESGSTSRKLSARQNLSNVSSQTVSHASNLSCNMTQRCYARIKRSQSWCSAL